MKDTKTQAFLDLYVDRNSRVYRPPATEDVAGNIATVQHLEEVAAQERDLLAKIADIPFTG